MNSSPQHRLALSPAVSVLLLAGAVAGCVTTTEPVQQATPKMPDTRVVHVESNRTAAPANEVPVSTNFPTTTQRKLQATQHWARIADDSGRAIAELLKKYRLCNTQFDRCKAIYVNPPVNVTEFSRAFHNQLTTSLVKSGVLIGKTPRSELSLDIDVQPISFSVNRPQYRWSGAAVELDPGVWARRDVIQLSPGQAAETPPGPDELHWLRTEYAAGATPQTEILVTVSVSDKDKYLARATNAYYIADGDRRLYDQEICSLIRLCPSVGTVSTSGTVATTEPAKEVAGKPRSVGVVSGDCPLGNACPETTGEAAKPKRAAKKK